MRTHKRKQESVTSPNHQKKLKRGAGVCYFFIKKQIQFHGVADIHTNFVGPILGIVFPELLSLSLDFFEKKKPVGCGP